MKIPNIERAVISDAKISDYILNSDHTDGWSKARFFESFGFEKSGVNVFKEALHELIRENDVTESIDTQFGVKFVVEGQIISPDGRNPIVKSIWIIQNGEDFPKFVTVYPI